MCLLKYESKMSLYDEVHLDILYRNVWTTDYFKLKVMISSAVNVD